MKNFDLYPAHLPESLKELPELFDGNLAKAAQMTLAVQDNEAGLAQCNAIEELLSNEMVSGPKGVTCENFVKLKKIVSDATDWHVETCKDDKVVNVKMDVIWQLEFCVWYIAKNAYCTPEQKNPYDADQPVRMLVQASYLVRVLREIFEKQILARKLRDLLVGQVERKQLEAKSA